MLLKEKRGNGKTLAESINTCKARIDRILAELSVDNRSDASDTAKFDPNLERRREALQAELEQLKAQYKRDAAQFKSLKNEIEYCSRLVDQCRRRLVTDFEIWFSSVYGSVLQEQQNNDEDGLQGVFIFCIVLCGQDLTDTMLSIHQMASRARSRNPMPSTRRK